GLGTCSYLTGQQCSCYSVFVSNKIAYHKPKAFFSPSYKLLIRIIDYHLCDPFKSSQSLSVLHLVVLCEHLHHRCRYDGRGNVLIPVNFSILLPVLKKKTCH